MRSILPLLVLISLSRCGPVTKENESILKTAISNFVNCMNEDIMLCLKENALKVTERLATTRELKIADGLTYINSDPEIEEKSAKSLSEVPELRKKEISEGLKRHTTTILNNGEFEVDFPGFGEDDDEESAVEARGKKGKKKLKMLIPLLLLAKAKAVALMTAFLGIIAFSIFKIMVMLKIAFIAKALAILKWLLSKHHHHHEEHGWIPHHEEHHDHHGWDGGWGRSKSDAQNLAYAAHRK